MLGPRQDSNLPGRKSDVSDAAWLVQLCSLIRCSRNANTALVSPQRRNQLHRLGYRITLAPTAAPVCCNWADCHGGCSSLRGLENIIAEW